MRGGAGAWRREGREGRERGQMAKKAGKGDTEARDEVCMSEGTAA